MRTAIGHRCAGNAGDGRDFGLWLDRCDDPEPDRVADPAAQVVIADVGGYE